MLLSSLWKLKRLLVPTIYFRFSFISYYSSSLNFKLFTFLPFQRVLWFLFLPWPSQVEERPVVRHLSASSPYLILRDPSPSHDGWSLSRRLPEKILSSVINDRNIDIVINSDSKILFKYVEYCNYFNRMVAFNRTFLVGHPLEEHCKKGTLGCSITVFIYLFTAID